MKRASLVLLALLGLAVLGIGGVITFVQTSELEAIRASEHDVATTTYALVLGASIKADGTASDALSDRVLTAARLYRLGKVSTLIMTGDDGAFRRNEVDVMKALAISEGVSSTDILVDRHGYRTYESCKRAVHTFGATSTVIITQRFHLSRALFLCKRFGMDAQGFPADLQPYDNIWMFMSRDLLASFKAWIDIYLWAPQSPVK